MLPVESLPYQPASSVFYLLFAFQDQNKDLKLETSKEAYGFYGDTLSLNQSVDSIFLPIQKLNTRDIIILSKFPIGRYFDINFNKAISDFVLESANENIDIIANLLEGQEKLRVYNTFENIDSLETFLTVTDSIDQVAQDTFYIKFNPSEREPNPLTYSIKPNNNSAIETDFVGVLNFSKPVASINYDSIYFVYDSLTNVDVSATDSLVWSEHRDRLIMYKTLFNPADTISASTNTENENGSNKRTSPEIAYYSGKGAFIGFEQDSSQQKSLTYNFKIPEQYGTIKGNIDTEYISFIVQLLDNRNKVVSQIINDRNFVFDMIEPGEYRIRILVDENNNGEWDPGNIHQLIEPERVLFFRDETTNTEKLILKANWELMDNNINF